MLCLCALLSDAAAPLRLCLCVSMCIMYSNLNHIARPCGVASITAGRHTIRKRFAQSYVNVAVQSIQIFANMEILR